MSKMDEYKHPQWQKMRLEALSLHRFTCQRCLDNQKTLNVHHKRYPKGKKIWECDISDLSVLCEDCHEEIENLVSFSREYGTELLMVIDDVLGISKPKRLLQMFIDYTDFSLNEEARAAFSIAVRAIEDAITYQDGRRAD